MSGLGHLNLKLNINVILTKPSSWSNFFNSSDDCKAKCQPGRSCLDVETNSSDQHSFSFVKNQFLFKQTDRDKNKERPSIASDQFILLTTS